MAKKTSETFTKEFLFKTIHRVVHELKSPLTSIKGATDLILSKSLGEIPAQVEQFLHIIQRGIVQLDRLIDTLLDHSAITTDSLKLDMKMENVMLLINDAIASVQRFADEYKIALDTTVPENISEIYADGNRIKQILINLLTNAIKFTPSPGKITVSAHEEGENIIFKVKDTGIGIPGEYIDRIFDEFYKVPQLGIQEKMRGSGLGLSIVRGIVEAHGGKIWVESEVGIGSTFIFSIPKNIDKLPARNEQIVRQNLAELVDITVLQEIQDKFASAINVPVIIVDANGNLLTKPSGLSQFCNIIRNTRKGKIKCRTFIRKVVKTAAIMQKSKIFFCDAGLGHFVAPIISDNAYLGAIVIEGTQVFTPVSQENIHKLSKELNIELSELARVAKTIKRFPENNVYTAGDLLISIANTIASLCKERSQLAHKVAELSTMATIGRFITSTLNIENLLNSILHTTIDVLNADGGIISMIDSTTGRLKSKVYSGTGGQIVSGTKRRIGESISAIVATEKTPIVLNQRSDHTLSSILKEEGISSLMCIPLEAKGKLIGVFNINRVSGMDFTKDDLKFFTTVGAQAAIAIEESILYQSIEEKVRQLNIFHKVGQALISTFGLQQMLDLIVKAISQLMHTKRCSLRLLADDTHRTIITASCGLSETYCCNEGAVLDGKIMEHIIHKKTPIAIKDIQIDSRISNHECIIQEGLRSLLSVPLIMRDEVLGIVTVYSSEIYEYTKEEIELLSTFAAQAAIAIENTQLFEATRRELFKVAADLAEAIDQRDGYDKNHTTAMVEYCVKVAKKLRLPPEQIESIKISALLHDIGKLCIPENILLKKGNLTQEEQKLIKKHTLFGTEIIEKINLPWNIKEAILQHHERIDGKGYPDGVIGNEINMEALIIEVVEAYEAMITRRPYREALSREEAIEELKRCSGKEFEPKVVDAFLEVLQEEEKQ